MHQRPPYIFPRSSKNCFNLQPTDLIFLATCSRVCKQEKWCEPRIINFGAMQECFESHSGRLGLENFYRLYSHTYENLHNHKLGITPDTQSHTHIFSCERSPGLHCIFQIHDLKDGRPLSTLNLCQLLPDTQFIILICGGDGTVNWVLSEVERLALNQEPFLAILPLGTGNDLSNSLGWGTSYDDFQSIENILAELRFASPITVDRWTLRIRPLRRRFLPLTNHSKNITMTNYFSIGCDALIALNFHKQRKRKPGFFTVRSINRLFYFGYGAMDVLEQHCKNLEENIELWLDGGKIELPPLEGLLFLNISSWGGGCRIWDNSLSDESDWVCSNPGDGRFEVIGISSSFHMAQIQVNLAEPIRFGQASHARVLVKSKVPMQSDGEPWEQNHCHINISFHKQVTFLSKTFNVSDDSSEIIQLETT